MKNVVLVLMIFILGSGISYAKTNAQKRNPSSVDVRKTAASIEAARVAKEAAQLRAEFAFNYAGVYQLVKHLSEDKDLLLKGKIYSGGSTASLGSTSVKTAMGGALAEEAAAIAPVGEFDELESAMDAIADSDLKSALKEMLSMDDGSELKLSCNQGSGAEGVFRKIGAIFIKDLRAGKCVISARDNVEKTKTVMQWDVVLGKETGPKGRNNWPVAMKPGANDSTPELSIKTIISSEYKACVKVIRDRKIRLFELTQEDIVKLEESSPSEDCTSIMGSGSEQE